MATILENVYTLSAHLEDAYAALEGKGATIPQQKNAANLSATIDSVPAGGSDITVGDLLQPTFAQVEELKDLVIGVSAIDAALTSTAGLTAGPGYALFANRSSVVKTADFRQLSSIGTSGCQYMFLGQRNLQSVSGFSPTNIQTYGCHSMFRDCVSLSSFSGSFSVATAINGIGHSMFWNCTSLTAAPSLPATTLNSECYRNMFYGCTSLTTAPALPATTLAANCYNSMFRDCTSLTSAPALNITSLRDYCCSYMFQNCTSLSSLPSFAFSGAPAPYCFQDMFNGCASLTGPLPSFEGISFTSTAAFQRMYRGCASLTGSVVISTTSRSGSPASNVFNSMFADCPGIQKVTLDFTTYTSIPSLGNIANVNVFNNATDARLEIRVPASLEASWKTATNWSTYADRIVGV